MPPFWNSNSLFYSKSALRICKSFVFHVPSTINLRRLFRIKKILYPIDHHKFDPIIKESDPSSRPTFDSPLLTIYSLSKLKHVRTHNTGCLLLSSSFCPTTSTCKYDPTPSFYLTHNGFPTYYCLLVSIKLHLDQKVSSLQCWG